MGEIIAWPRAPTPLPFTGERLTSGYGGQTEIEHLHRYLLAREWCRDKDVLDVASGEGYGTALLAQVARRAVGVEIAPDVVEHASGAYKADSLSFVVGDARALPIPDASFDVVTSFETIEHFAEQRRFLDEVKRVLRPGGLLIVSTPDRDHYSPAESAANPFHVRELTQAEFETLLRSSFAEVSVMLQRPVFGSVLFPDGGGKGAPLCFERRGDRHFEGSLNLPRPQYVVAFASDKPVPPPPSVYIDTGRLGMARPADAEAQLADLEDEVRKAMNEVTRLTTENVSLRTNVDFARGEVRKAVREIRRLTPENSELRESIDRIRDENSELRKSIDRMRDANAAREGALYRLATDANSVLDDKWWRRTRHLRRMSNSLRKLRGRSKKRWPRAFLIQDYLAAEPLESAAEPLERVTQEPRFIPSFMQRCAPHLTVVAMARNEAARAHDIMRHFCALFDRVIIIDHLSNDQTAQIVQSYNGLAGTDVIVLRGEDAGYYQSEYMSAVASALLAEGASDWIFFLDFDEFLPFQDAVSFRQALVDHAGQDVIHMHWHNLALARFDCDALQGAQALISSVVSSYVKIAVNGRRIAPGRITICQGNHAVLLPGENAPYTGERAFGLFHVPIISVEALHRKVEQGTGTLAVTVGKDADLGTHWNELHNQIDLLTSNADLRREAALHYGRSMSELLTLVAEGVATEARPFTLRFAQSDRASALATANPVDTFTLDTIDEVLRSHFAPKQTPSDLWEQLRTPLYASLPVRSLPAPELGAGRDRIEHAILSAATDVEIVVPTAWLGHIPFLFTLMETFRPRRYVELGTHAGASFFAACQHIRSNNNYGEAIAIDTWTGDHQAGFYDENVFDDFKRHLYKHFPRTGKFIRGYFADAVSCFEDRSIDLIHIDGLHAYTCVREDYETWRPKVAENGVIIFHDTNEFQSDFGAWQLFDEVRDQAAASFQFRHGHGLGVMAFGSRRTNPVVELIDHFNIYSTSIESYYSVLGKSLFDAARFRRS